MRRNIIGCCLAMIVSMVLIPGQARPDSFSFSFSGTWPSNVPISSLANHPFSAFGTFITNPGIAGTYQVISITGSFINGVNSSSMTLLSPGTFGANDNKISFPASPSVDTWGLGFYIGNNPNDTNDYYNLFYVNSNYPILLEVAQDNWLRAGSITNFTLDNAPVPEPATLLLLGSGLFGIVFFRKNLKK